MTYLRNVANLFSLLVALVTPAAALTAAITHHYLIALLMAAVAIGKFIDHWSMEPR